MEPIGLRDLELATGGRLQHVDNAGVFFRQISIDSRSVHPEDVFWAIRGATHDGHDFIGEAFRRQASLCVVSVNRASEYTGPILIVDDTLAALGRFSKWYRSRTDALVIGVTGSVGKTTTRELIYSALSAQFQGIRSRQNYNNLIGLPLSLLDIESCHEFAVVEMGAARIGDIQQLCELANPEIGAVTSIGPVHLESFGSLKSIVRTKGELLERLPTSGFAVLPGDEPIVRQMADLAPCPVIFVGQGDDNQIRATEVEANHGRLRFRCEGAHFEIGLNGRHLVSNALIAIAIGLEIGISPSVLAKGLARFEPIAGRGNFLRIGSITIIDDTYNASPISVAAACHALNEIDVPQRSRRLVILGDMLELGEIAQHEHEQIGNLIGHLAIDRLLVCGRFADDVARGAINGGMPPNRVAVARDMDTILMVLDCWLDREDIVLVKGSRGMKMERVVEWIETRMKIHETDQPVVPRRFCA